MLHVSLSRSVSFPALVLAAALVSTAPGDDCFEPGPIGCCSQFLSEIITPNPLLLVCNGYTCVDMSFVETNFQTAYRTSGPGWTFDRWRQAPPGGPAGGCSFYEPVGCGNPLGSTPDCQYSPVMSFFACPDLIPQGLQDCNLIVKD